MAIFSVRDLIFKSPMHLNLILITNVADRGLLALIFFASVVSGQSIVAQVEARNAVAKQNPAGRDLWNYAANEQPAYSQEGGKKILISYYNPSSLTDGNFVFYWIKFDQVSSSPR